MAERVWRWIGRDGFRDSSRLALGAGSRGVWRIRELFLQCLNDRRVSLLALFLGLFRELFLQLPALLQIELTKYLASFFV
jgi:hypothetical protein